MDFVDILLWSLWISVWFMFIFLVFRFMWDAWRDDEIGVGAKIVWTLFLAFVPVIGALTYLIARGRGMAERDLAASRDYRHPEVTFSKSLAYDDAAIDTLKPHQAGDEIATARALLDSGAITAEEFARLEARARA